MTEYFGCDECVNNFKNEMREQLYNFMKTRDGNLDESFKQNVNIFKNLNSLNKKESVLL